MNGSQIRVIIDTNVIFMALYDENSKAGKIIGFANNNQIQLFSPDSVKKELLRVLKREMNLSDYKISFIMDNLPITWVEKEVYERALDKTRVKHKADKPIEAVSLILDCSILSADKHFKNRININKLLIILNKKRADKK